MSDKDLSDEAAARLGLSMPPREFGWAGIAGHWRGIAISLKERLDAIQTGSRSDPYGNDQLVAYRLENHDLKMRIKHLEANLQSDILKVVRVSIIQATIDADEEIARLRDELKTLNPRRHVG